MSITRLQLPHNVLTYTVVCSFVVRLIFLPYFTVRCLCSVCAAVGHFQIIHFQSVHCIETHRRNKIHLLIEVRKGFTYELLKEFFMEIVSLFSAAGNWHGDEKSLLSTRGCRSGQIKLIYFSKSVHVCLF